MQRYCLSPVLFAWCIYGTFFFMAQQPLLGQGLVVLEASRSHSDTPPPLDEWSARRRDLYLTTHNTHKRQASMLSAGFEPANPASERPQTHALARAVTEFGPTELNNIDYILFEVSTETCCLNSVVGHICLRQLISCKQHRWNYVSFHKNLSSHRTLKHNLTL